MHSSLPFTQNPKPRTIEPTPNHFHPSLFSAVSRSLSISFHPVLLYLMFVTERVKRVHWSLKHTHGHGGSWSIY